jgi:hypothetical protein
MRICTICRHMVCCLSLYNIITHWWWLQKWLKHVGMQKLSFVCQLKNSSVLIPLLFKVTRKMQAYKLRSCNRNLTEYVQLTLNIIHTSNRTTLQNLLGNSDHPSWILHMRAVHILTLLHNCKCRQCFPFKCCYPSIRYLNAIVQKNIIWCYVLI